jgi:hypothetical protein
MSFFEVLAGWVKAVQQIAMDEWWEDNPDSSEKIAADAFLAKFQCPITFQELMIILRANVMGAFEDTQFAVQGLFPRTADLTENEFVALVAGMGTAYIPGTANMSLPIVMRENLLDLTMRSLPGGAGPARPDVENWKNPTEFIPVVGVYETDRVSLVASDYRVRVSQLQPDPIEYSYENSFYSFPLELNIDMVDGKQGTAYIAINNPKGLAIITERWNAWVAKMSNNMCPVGNLSSDKGADVFYSLGMTRHHSTEAVVPDNQPPLTAEEIRQLRRGQRPRSGKLQAVAPSEGTLDDWQGIGPENDGRYKIEQKAWGLSPYATRKVQAVSSYTPFVESAWQMLMSFWILPVNRVSPNSPGPGDYSGLTRMAAATSEMNIVFQSQTAQGEVGGITSSFVELHQLYIDTMTKSRYADKNAVIRVLEDLSTAGQGGILTALGTALAGVFAPPLVPIVSSIGESLGV